jgi:hypothetical protein
MSPLVQSQETLERAQLGVQGLNFVGRRAMQAAVASYPAHRFG